MDYKMVMMSQNAELMDAVAAWLNVKYESIIF